MSRLVFLLEDRSMKVFLEQLLPRLFPNLSFLCVEHEGKNDLEKSIPRKLKGWKEPGAQFLVLRDNDGGDCRITNRRISEICKAAGRPDTIIRLACQELEGWYLGCPSALAQAFGKPKLQSLANKARYREPDTIQRPSEELTRLLPEFQKVSAARMMGATLERDNRSHSFHTLLKAIEAK